MVFCSYTVSEALAMSLLLCPYCPPPVYTNRWPLIASSSVPLHLFAATYTVTSSSTIQYEHFISESQMFAIFYTTKIDTLILYSLYCTSGTVKTSSILWRIVTLYLLFRKLLLRKPWHHLFLYFYLQTILYLMLIFIPSWNIPDVILHLTITVLLPRISSYGQWSLYICCLILFFETSMVHFELLYTCSTTSSSVLRYLGILYGVAT